jgi:hypothetical protein
MFWTQVRPKDEAETRRNLNTVELPDTAMLEASVLHVLNEGLGFRKSSERGACMLGDGRHIPMMSYSLIEYVMGLDLSDCTLLELGGGYSTDFWSRRVQSVLTLETDEQWAGSLRKLNLANTEIHAVAIDALADTVSKLDRSFDGIVIDPNTNRYRCAKAALPRLKPGGFIILDNSEWYPNTTSLLRGADLIQVDFPDFRPLRWYRCASSIFLHRDFRARPQGGRMPLPPIGGKDIAAMNDWDAVTD